MPLGRVYSPAPLNTAHRLAEGLVSAWLPLPETSGGKTLYDLREKYTATVTGASWVGCPGGPALSFSNTAAHYVSTGSASNAAFNPASGSPICGAMVCTPTTLTPSSVGVLFSRRNTDGGWALYLLTTGALRLVAERSDGLNGFTLDTGTSVLTVGKRSTVAFRMNCDGEAQICVDGVSVAASSFAAYTPYSATDNLLLGGEPSTPRAWPGTVESWWLWRGPTYGTQEFVGLHDQVVNGYPDLLRRVTTAAWFVGGGSTSVSGPDTAALADAGAVAAASTGTESASVADVAALIATVSGTDAAALTEAGSIALASADTATATDAASVAATTAVADTATATDAGTLAATAAGSDAISASDASSLAAVSTAPDLVALSDTAGISLVLSDAAALSDAATVAVAVTDAIAGTDASSLTASLTATESVAVADAGNVSGSSSPVANDPVALAESWSLAVTLAVADTLTLTDTGGLTAALTLADTVAAADARTLTAIAVAADYGSVADGGAVSTGDTTDYEPHLFMAL